MDTIPFTPANQKHQKIERVTTRLALSIAFLLIVVTAYEGYRYWGARTAYTHAHASLQTATGSNTNDAGLLLLKKYSNPPRPSPAALVSLLARVTPATVRLTQVARRHKKQVTLTGTADTLDTLMAYLQRLHDAPLLRDVTLKTVTTDAQKKSITFSIHACIQQVGGPSKV
ncbi:MAG: PilN domain-containing protein [Candidatus Babeliales bacterium]